MQTETGCFYSDFLCFAVVNLLYMFIFFHNRLFRLFCQKADNYDCGACQQECGQEFVDVPCAAQRTNEIFPDEYGCTADNHTRKRAPFIGAFPEQGRQHDRPERCAEARPCERYNIRLYDLKDGAWLNHLLIENRVQVYSSGFHHMDLEEYFLNRMDNLAEGRKGGEEHV